MPRRKLINPGLALTLKPCPKLLKRLIARTQFDEATGCWIWQGRIDSNGYGQIFVKGQARAVHRVGFALMKRPIRAGREIDHDERYCRCRACWNPAHLRESTKSANSSRGARRKSNDDIPF